MVFLVSGTTRKRKYVRGSVVGEESPDGEINAVVFSYWKHKNDRLSLVEKANAAWRRLRQPTGG